MAQHCRVCTHPKRDAINRRLLKAGETGETLATIGDAYGVSTSSLDRHKANHLKVSAGLVSEAKNALTIVAYASDLYERATRVADRAERYLENVESDDVTSRSVQAAASALRELRGSIEVLARLVVSAPPEVEPQANSWLDQALTEAVQSLVMAELPAGTQGEIAEAVIVHAPE